MNLLGAASGALLVLSLPKPDLYPLAWFALIPLFSSIAASPDYRRAGVAAYSAGLIFFGGTCYWIAETMTVYGGLNRGLAAGIALLFASVYALFFAAFGLTLYGFCRALGTAGLLFAAPLWVTMELMRAHFFFGGFPWMLSGYALVPYLGVLQVAAWTGIYGLSFLAAAVNSILTLGVGRGRLQFKWVFPGATLIVVASLLPLLDDSASGEPLSLRIVQPNISIDQPWRQPESDRLMEDLHNISTVGRDDKLRLIVWPETPAPFYLAEDAGFRQRVQRIAREANAYLLLGYVGAAGESPANSAGLIAPQGNLVFRYDKMHLVPFGEYVPLENLLFFAEKMVRQVGDFVPGTEYTLGALDDRRISAVICYESIFPGLVREFVKRGSELIVVITNDGWFGESSAPFQHLRMGIVRAVENRRYVIRSANSGVSAIIDPYGRVIRSTDVGVRTFLDGDAQFLRERTFYSEHGDLFAYLNVAAVFLGVAIYWRGRRSKPKR